MDWNTLLSHSFVIAANNAIFDFIYRVEAMLWFSIDNTKHIGVGAIGLGTGSGAVFYPLFSGVRHPCGNQPGSRRRRGYHVDGLCSATAS